MPLTLLEASKKFKGDVVRQAVIQIYAASHPLLAFLPFNDIPGNALKYNQEESLPGIGFRGVNEGYTESVGILNPVTETLSIAGGDVDVDKFILKTMGNDQRAVQEAMKIKALAHTWAKTFIKGDSSTTPREFDGLQTRLTGTQLIAAGSTSGGDALSLAKLDEAIDAVDDAQALFMTKAMRRRLTTAARATAVGGYITYGVDAFGRKITQYNDLPIIIADPNSSPLPILGFNEANPGGGSAVGTSIYVLSFGDGRLGGIQNGDMQVTDLGELQTKPMMRTRIEWYAGISVYHPRSAARLYGISNAAVVA